MASPLSRATFGALFRFFKGLTMAGVWLDRSLRPKLPFPRDPEQLREQRTWCLDALRAAGALPADARVSAFEVEDFKRGEAFRSRVATVRVVWDGGALDLLAKFAPTAASLRDHAIFILQGNHLKEAGVYARLAADPAVASPRAWFAESHKNSGNLCVLMERMAPAREIREVDGCPEPLLEQAIDAFAALHARFWGGEDPAADFLTTVPDAVIDYFGTLFEGPDRALFGDLLRQVWTYDGQAPVTVLHGDARVGNMLFGADDGAGRFVFIDWQAARKGKGVFDVAYFLVLSVDPAIRRAHEQALLDRYLAGLLAGGVAGYSREALMDDYRNAVLLVLAFVSLPFLSAESSDTDANQAGLRELGDIWAARMMAAVEDLDMGWISARYGLDAEALREAFARSNARASGAQGAQ